MDIQGVALKLPTMAATGVGIARPDGVKPEGVGAEGGAESLGGGFGKALTDALEGISSLQKAADEKAVELAAGEPVDLHDVILTRETASLHMQLALQVRNKMVEAYQEVMRMQI
jgi:flagellar hook-basal body complex protein FliE